MRTLLRWAAAIGLGLLPMGRADAMVTNYHGAKVAYSGRKSLMGATTNLDADCNWLGISPADVTEPPRRGKLFVMRSVDYPQFTKENERYKCRFKKYSS